MTILSDLRQQLLQTSTVAVYAVADWGAREVPGDPELVVKETSETLNFFGVDLIIRLIALFGHVNGTWGTIYCLFGRNSRETWPITSQATIH